LAKIGLSVTPKSVQQKLLSWQEHLDKEIIELKDEWKEGGNVKYQLIGDNWDKTILPSYRTSQDKTISLHLFHLFAIIDRISGDENVNPIKIERKLAAVDFIPSLEEQRQLKKDLSFLIASSLIQNIDILNQEFGKIYPTHLEHEFSHKAHIKASQVLHLIV